jgi:hypothetical protein
MGGNCIGAFAPPGATLDSGTRQGSVARLKESLAEQRHVELAQRRR